MTSSTLSLSDVTRPPRWRAPWDRMRARGGWSLVVGTLAFPLLMLWAAYNRWNFVFNLHPPKNFVWSDMAGYVDRAQNLGSVGVKLSRFDTFYPPGTHIMMAPFFRLANGDRELGMAYAQYMWWVLATLTLWAVGGMGWKLFKHPLAGVLAMGGLMMHWPFTVFTGLYMSENPFSAFMAMSLLAGLVASDMDPQRPWRRAPVFALAGLLAGVGTIIRPQYGIGAVLIGLPLLHRRFPFVRFKEAIPLAVMFLLPVAAAMELNSHAAGIRMGLSGNAGFNFYQGHCDVVSVETHEKNGAGGWYKFAAPVRIQRVAAEGRPEKHVVFNDNMAWDNAFFFSEGFKCIQADGWSHLRRVYTNVEDLFSPADPWPPNSGRFARASNWANHFYSHSLFFLLPMALLLSRWRRPERWLLIQMATLLPVGLIFYGDSRYRVPYDMFGFLILAGILCAVLGLRRDARRIPGVGWRSSVAPPN